MSEMNTHSEGFNELEYLAALRAEHEKIPRMPKTPEEMNAATLDPVTGCLDNMIAHLSRLAVGNLSTLRDILFQINSRLLAYLKSEEIQNKKKIQSPSIYARHLFGASAGTARESEKIVAIADMTAYMTAELNPLLHAAWGEYHALTSTMTDDEKSLRGFSKNIDEFFLTLDSGIIKNQRIISFFGVLKEIAKTHENFPLPDAKMSELPKEILISDPYGIEQKDYWFSRQRAYKSYFNRYFSLKELAAGRTLLTINCLAETALATQDPALKEAIEHIGLWIGGEYMQMEGRNGDEDFERYVAGLHFGYGDTETLIALLNSLELLKQKSPELFARIIGRAPRPFSPNDTRSDLFGNLLHAALFRSIHMQTGKGTEGYAELQSFLTGLTRFEAGQPTIAPLSDEEFAQLEKMFAEYMEQAGDSAMRFFPAIMFGEKRRSYLLAKILERVSAENREQLLSELRNASPSEFERLMHSRRLLPRGLRWYEHSINPLPADVSEVLKERGFPEVAKDISEKAHFIRALYAGKLIKTAPRIAGQVALLPIRAVGGLIGGSLAVAAFPIILIVDPTVMFSAAASNVSRGVESLKETIKRNKDIAEHESHRIHTLWKTMPSEKLLRGDEFYTYLKKIAYRIKKRDTRRIENRNANQKDADFLLDILNAHADITTEQWQQWLYELKYERIGKIGQRRIKEPIAVEAALSSIFEYYYKPSDSTDSSTHPVIFISKILESSSNFFRLFESLFPRSTYLLGDVSYIAGSTTMSYYEWLAQKKDSLRRKEPIDLSQSKVFRDFVRLDDLSDKEKITLKNLQLLSKLFLPTTLAVELENFFTEYPGTFDLFCEMLCAKDMAQFLECICRKMMLSDEVFHYNNNQADFLFVVLRKCNRAIPNNEEYLDLKNAIIQRGLSFRKTRDKQRRIIRFDSEQNNWVLE